MFNLVLDPALGLAHDQVQAPAVLESMSKLSKSQLQVELLIQLVIKYQQAHLKVQMNAC